MKSSLQFNKMIANCVKDIDIINAREKSGYEFVYKSEDDYEKSLTNNLGKFNLTQKEKKSIDCIMYNFRNNDGVFSAAIAYHYIYSENKVKPLIIRNGEGEFQLNKVLNLLQDKTVLILDLEYKETSYEKLSNTCKQVYTIDDHQSSDVSKFKNVKVFSGNDSHASVGFVWKIFYPKIKTPLIIQTIDINDSKKPAQYIHYSNFLATAFGFRYSQNPKIPINKWLEGEIFDELWTIIENDKNQLWIILGSYMDEVQENIKEQIARNAIIKNFQGYKVGVLNFVDPVLYKKVGRQICSNLQGKIDFALLWGYEHNKNLFKISIIDDHKQNYIDLGEIARKMGNAGGTSWKGSGHKHVGNFYWPNLKNKTIWDIFEQKYI